MTEEKKTEEVMKEAEAEKECQNAAEEPEKAAEEAKEAEPELSPLEKLQKNYDELNDRYYRVNAEYQNFRRRTEKEKSDIYAFANEEFAKQLLDVIDNFERAMDAETADEKYKEGMELIFKQLQGVLEKNHVSEIEALGKPFDPNFHNAVMNDASSDAESGIVTKVLQKGYMLNSRVIRPAMVAVAQ